MSAAHLMIELWRGPLLESAHAGHAVICDASGGIVDAWGDPDAVIYPRSSIKMIQALPMMEAGVSLPTDRMALACSSHEGAPVHVAAVRAWLRDEGFRDGDLMCGCEAPRDRALRHAMIREGEAPEQAHNQCSGKHAGFLQFHRHLGGKGAYVDPDGALQRKIRQSFEDVTGESSPGYGIDGCAAPNFATTVTGLARAMAAYAGAVDGADARQGAMVRLREAMMAHPLLVAGEGKATTLMMEAAPGKLATKSGAEGVFVAILPEKKMGVALKIVDGAARAADAAMAALLVRLGILGAGDSAVRAHVDAPIMNRAGAEVGIIRKAEGFA